MVKIKIRWFLEHDSPLTVCAWLPNNGGQCVGTNRLPSVGKWEADTTKRNSHEKSSANQKLEFRISWNKTLIVFMGRRLTKICLVKVFIKFPIWIKELKTYGQLTSALKKAPFGHAPSRGSSLAVHLLLPSQTTYLGDFKWAKWQELPRNCAFVGFITFQVMRRLIRSFDIPSGQPAVIWPSSLSGVGNLNIFGWDGEFQQE